VDVRASRGAVRYIRKRGGSLYLWTDDDEMLTYATNEAAADVPFRRFSGPGFALFLEKRVNLGEWVGIERSPFPPWRLLIGFEFMQIQGQGPGAWY
jgi:hypothetical protein